jgi:hypothetical protein
MISSSCRKLSGYRRYQRTQRIIISASKCRPLNSAGRFRRMLIEAYQTVRRCNTTRQASSSHPSCCTAKMFPAVGLVWPRASESSCAKGGGSGPSRSWGADQRSNSLFLTPPVVATGGILHPIERLVSPWFGC